MKYSISCLNTSLLHMFENNVQVLPDLPKRPHYGLGLQHRNDQESVNSVADNTCLMLHLNKCQCGVEENTAKMLPKLTASVK